MLEHLSKTGKPLSEVMRPYTEGHFMSGELNYRVKDIQKVIAAVKQQYAKDGKEDFTDGYSLESSDWRFNIRPSNTEPLLRLNIEARKAGLVEKLTAEIEAIIKSEPK
jgi:phosphomannomutase